jgi:hypothetical protein
MARLIRTFDREYGLHIHSPLTNDAVFFERVTDIATRVRQSKRHLGGFWDLSFTISRGQLAPRGLLREWFDNRIFFVVEQVVGGQTVWRGFIWRMDLTLDGVTLRREYSEIYNAIKTVYTDEDGNDALTAYYTDSSSIAHYGRRELLLYMRNVNSAAAIAAAQTALLEMKQPWPRTVGLDPENADQLEIMCVGMIFTANNKFVGATTLDSSSTNVSTVIKDIATNDCEFLSPGRADVNTIQYKRELNQPVRAWDLISELTAMGDGTDPYRVWVNTAEFLHYGIADNTPRYIWQGHNRGLQTAIGQYSTADNWALEPGVLRDMTRPSGLAIPGSFLTDSRDSWIYEVEMADGLTFPYLKPEGSEEDEIKRAMGLYRRWLEVEGDVPIVREDFNG